MIDIKAIRARAEAATEGPWGTFPGATCVGLKAFPYVTVAKSDSQSSDDAIARCTELSNDRFKHDATFIAHARADIPALCDEVERLRAVVRESLEVVCYPDNGALVCRWCRTPYRERDHDPQCWYARQLKDVGDYFRAARAALEGSDSDGT